MKYINKILFLFFAIVFTISCRNLDLDLQANPNAVTPDQAGIEELYNAVQLAFENVFVSAQFNPGAMARMYHVTAFNYRAATTPNTFAALWSNAYSSLFPDIDALIALANPSEGAQQDIYAGTAKIMKAYTLMVLVDLFGDVPYSEINQGISIISPKSDPSQDVYNAAREILSEAIQQLTSPDDAGGTPAFDNFYGGDTDKWIAFANSLLLRANLNEGNYAAVLNDSLAIDASSNDFEWQYGNQRTNPNSRHPLYNNHYEVDDGDYLSNYYMWLLIADKSIVDPRLRYYFRRKVNDAANQDSDVYSCHFGMDASLPATVTEVGADLDHWRNLDLRLPYCIAAANGYLGRDHLNGQGIPPDGPIRTSYGLYPAGGDFDADDFNDTREGGTTGGRGEGIQPIMLYSFVQFMKAEAALRMAQTSDARTFLENGIKASLDKVQSFESLVQSKLGEEVRFRDGNLGTIADIFGMTDIIKSDYINFVLDLFDNSNDKLAVVAKEFYIAAWGNGLEAYNIYRRTGFPNNMQPPLEQAQLEFFPMSFFLPINHVSRNANVEQKTDLSEPIHWQKDVTLFGNDPGLSSN